MASPLAKRKKGLLTSVDENELSATPQPADSVIGGWTIHLSKELGRGTWSVVYECEKGSLQAAVKVVPKAKLKPHEVGFVRVECSILQKVKGHPNIVQFYELLEDAENFYIFLERLVGIDLFVFLEENHKVSERVARALFLQLVDAVSRLHQLGIVHRDLKLENILISEAKNGGGDESRKLTLIDFGLSAELPNPDHLLSDWCGSPLYASVELISKKPYRKEVDIWALGVILYCLVAGYQPFYGTTVGEIFHKITYQRVTYPEYFSHPLRDLIARMLDRNSQRRITIEDLRNHSWMRPSSTQLLGMRLKDGISQIAHRFSLGSMGS